MLSIILLANPNIFSSSMLFVLCTLLHYPWSCCTLFSVMHSTLPTFDLAATIHLPWNMLRLPHIPSEWHSVIYFAFDVIALLIVYLSTTSCKYYITLEYNLDIYIHRVPLWHQSNIAWLWNGTNRCVLHVCIIVMDVVLHLSDGRMFNIKIRELDSGGCRSSTPPSPRNAQCYIDRRRPSPVGTRGSRLPRMLCMAHAGCSSALISSSMYTYHICNLIMVLILTADQLRQ